MKCRSKREYKSNKQKRDQKIEISTRKVERMKALDCIFLNAFTAVQSFAKIKEQEPHE